VEGTRGLGLTCFIVNFATGCARGEDGWWSFQDFQGGGGTLFL
jgi:hypothetical protein